MKFRVQVTLTAQVTYTVEVEASERRRGSGFSVEIMSAESVAEDEATAQWRERTPEDFQVERGYITGWDCETEQLTAECEECGKEYPLPTDDTELCHCAAFPFPHIVIYQGQPTTPTSVKGVCTAPPWGIGDQYLCATCDAIERMELAAIALRLANASK